MKGIDVMSRFWGNARKDKKFRSLEVREASSSHLKLKFDIGINFKTITCRVNNFIGKRVGFSSVNYQRGRNRSSGITWPLSLGIGGSLSMSVGNSSQK